MKKIFITTFLVIVLLLGYYVAMVGVLKGWMNNFCQRKYCLEFLSLGDYLSILIAVIGLVFVVQSLDAWKEQDKFLNARNICNQLIKFQDLCEFDLILLIQEKQNEINQLASLEEQRKFLKNTFFELGLFQINQELDERLRQSNCLYKSELNEIYKVLNQCLNKMFTNIENEKRSFHNIDSFLNRAIRDDIKEVNNKLMQITQKLNKKIN
ncbi:hypothetical protein J671_2521 [Acinetobacter sp. 1130196]|uniref:Transmembrane protein n=4 Tax=Acinetobacter nosocomialis TaxID=106654 RepID=A0AA36KBX1_ACINO|nr:MULTISPECIES: hypothetical protein [Acinetobacter]KCX90483.1 hypothetical protein J568_3303 [Acinetobacter baumannii 6112]EEX00920.1 hypothetical protein HMPREF0014_00884 [Acinetobacter sp. RUH 2624]EKF48208.1 hypothetical protein W9I_02448 [Acinetobacter nosocomialis Ab22222]EKU6035982.1 hypothetical protein [Acinetobacter nosocomialis]ENV40020.1 hypothetical protein F958_03048 [Acinetobacter nosocomialis NIPH 386]